ncbi:DUF2141 domain-containing protein [Fibrella aquatilis]|uniref:DUF2141 domain-containing protein n=1 Tax=Fibrella aquatilis TaxID=2817059 RepID=A0A939G7D1_9BACT|nr:DUF2141 domain-containing protein [Fibrella aquatilis]MBO0931994.1 DUF2141 domain-containing protein [Fibrella aquatilis]
MLFCNYPFVTLSLLAITLGSVKAVGQPSTLQIDISAVRKNSGKIIVELYKDKANWLTTPFQRLTLSTDESTKTASFNVPQGKYAISIYQDVNGNGKLDQNFLGIPKEPIGFGNNYKPFGKPKFESASIDFTSASKPESIKLINAL